MISLAVIMTASFSDNGKSMEFTIHELIMWNKHRKWLEKKIDFAVIGAHFLLQWF
jgi:hypothetical protein